MKRTNFPEKESGGSSGASPEKLRRTGIAAQVLHLFFSRLAQVQV
jgi:hypothetical protein